MGVGSHNDERHAPAIADVAMQAKAEAATLEPAAKRAKAESAAGKPSGEGEPPAAAAESRPPAIKQGKSDKAAETAAAAATALAAAAPATDKEEVKPEETGIQDKQAQREARKRQREEAEANMSPLDKARQLAALVLSQYTNCHRLCTQLKQLNFSKELVDKLADMETKLQRLYHELQAHTLAEDNTDEVYRPILVQSIELRKEYDKLSSAAQALCSAVTPKKKAVAKGKAKSAAAKAKR